MNASDSSMYGSSPSPQTRDQESTSGLLSRLLSDASALLRNEIALAKTEAAKSIDSLRAGIAAVALAGAVLLGAFLTLIAAVVIALSQVVETWLAAAIVGAILACVGFLMLQAAKKKFSDPSVSLDQTKDSLERDVNLIARR